MKKQPSDIISATLNCVIMPNGEVICLGKRLGWFKDLKNELKPVADLAGNPIKEEDL